MIVKILLLLQPHEVPEAYKKKGGNEEGSRDRQPADGPSEITDSDEDVPLSHVKQKKVYKSVELQQLPFC